MLATLAVVGIGWISWEQYRLLEQSTTQTCLARAQAENDVSMGGLVMVGTSGAPDIREKILSSVSTTATQRINACS